MTRTLFLALASLLLVAGRPTSGAAAEPPDWAAVSRIFVERCIMCHSAHGAALGLRLDTYDGAVSGSAKGAVLRSRDAAGSELVRRLRGESLPRMPFLSYPLPPEQIDLITRWIEAGLPGTRDGPAATEPAKPVPGG